MIPLKWKLTDYWLTSTTFMDEEWKNFRYHLLIALEKISATKQLCNVKHWLVTYTEHSERLNGLHCRSRPRISWLPPWFTSRLSAGTNEGDHFTTIWALGNKIFWRKSNNYILAAKEGNCFRRCLIRQTILCVVSLKLYVSLGLKVTKFIEYYSFIRTNGWNHTFSRIRWSVKKPKTNSKRVYTRSWITAVMEKRWKVNGSG